jgi:hypothetical protein
VAQIPRAKDRKPGPDVVAHSSYQWRRGAEREDSLIQGGYRVPNRESANRETLGGITLYYGAQAVVANSLPRSDPT